MSQERSPAGIPPDGKRWYSEEFPESEGERIENFSVEAEQWPPSLTFKGQEFVRRHAMLEKDAVVYDRYLDPIDGYQRSELLMVKRDGTIIGHAINDTRDNTLKMRGQAHE